MILSTYAQRWIIASLLIVAVYAPVSRSEVNSSNTFQLPNNSTPLGHDEIRTSSGTSCRQSNGSGMTSEFGLIGHEEGDGAFYARITIPLGSVPTRLNCNSLYQMELDRLREELKLLREGLTFE